MADKSLTWYLQQGRSAEEAGPRYVMDDEYTVVRATIHGKPAPAARDVQVNFTNDGVDMLSSPLMLGKTISSSESELSEFSTVSIAKDSVVALRLVQDDNVALTVQLELEKEA